MQLSERDKSYIYDMLKYSNEIIDIIKDENHASFIRAEGLIPRRLRRNEGY